MSHWDLYAKSAVIEPLINDGSESTGIMEDKQIAPDFFDELFQGLEAKCDDNFIRATSDHSERVQPFLDCAKANSVATSLASFVRRLPWVSETRCKKINE
ncbi:hypothetical protein N7532_002308 [Penicillium argentinense]|uniref:Uncharacterized protein n=1 Tax=Penicillium argentinense TaxID=1131581 RepID=A0A9W9KLD1_9EURO|nr:uncharacterized protein N7532_002308 [Penicillium argentinense]KAJ5109663.1 hypothetical protein N7532_002308 [Penicillium argentinense]